MPIKAIHTNTLILNLFSENFANNVGMQLRFLFPWQFFMLYIFEFFFLYIKMLCEIKPDYE